jgi:hypothetical protein
MEREHEIAFAGVEAIDDGLYRISISTDDGERFEFVATQERLETLAAAMVSAAGIEVEDEDEPGEDEEPLLTVL